MGSPPVPQWVFVSQQKKKGGEGERRKKKVDKKKEKKKRKHSFPACAFQLLLRKSQPFHVNSCCRVTQGQLGYEAKVSSSELGEHSHGCQKGRENNFHLKVLLKRKAARNI